MTNLRRPLRKRLSETFSLGKIDVIRVLDAGDTTWKFIFRLTDGNLIESVLIPASLALYGGRSDRRTVCVSTQVGWHTAANSARAVWKVFRAICAQTKLPRSTTLCSWGMGEPLANLENGLRTIWIINAEWRPRYRPAPHYDLNQRVSAADSQTG